MQEYALYKGDRLLAIGTIHQIAKDQGVKPRTVYYYGTKAHKRKLREREESNNARVLVPIDLEV